MFTFLCSSFVQNVLFKAEVLFTFSIKRGQINYFFMPINRTLANFICHLQSFSSRNPGCLLNPALSLHGGDHIIFKCVEWKLAGFFQLCSASVYNKEMLDVNSLNRSVFLQRDECWGQSAVHPLPLSCLTPRSLLGWGQQWGLAVLGNGTDSLSHFVVALTLMLIQVCNSYSQRMPGSLGVDEVPF